MHVRWYVNPDFKKGSDPSGKLIVELSNRFAGVHALKTEIWFRRTAASFFLLTVNHAIALLNSLLLVPTR